MRRGLGDGMAFRVMRSSASPGDGVCVCGISGAAEIHVLSAIAQQVQRGEAAKLLVELNRGPRVGVQFPRCLVSFRMNDGVTGRTNGRSSAQCGHRSTSPTGGIKSGKAPRRPQTSHVNGTTRSSHRGSLATQWCGLARKRRLPGVASARHATAPCTHQHQQRDPELSKPLDQ
jgi:hypothetical protein